MARVDYEQQASQFRQARTLSEDVLDRWRRAVMPWLPAGGRILDLGAGTGQFAGPLAAWSGGQVVAVEPASAMRAEASRTRAVGWLAGRAEELPIRNASIDVAWLSTVVHHFVYLERAAAELRRVVAAEGRLLVRGFFPDRVRPWWFRFFPGIERAAATFPTLTSIAATIDTVGFALEAITEIEEPAGDPSTWLERLPLLRHADSLFRPLTDTEFADGIAAISEELGTSPTPRSSSTPLTFAVFTSAPTLPAPTSVRSVP